MIGNTTAKYDSLRIPYQELYSIFRLPFPHTTHTSCVVKSYCRRAKTFILNVVESGFVVTVAKKNRHTQDEQQEIRYYSTNRIWLSEMSY